MKKIRAIFFDLDGTLAPLEEKKFVQLYMTLLGKKAIEYGYDGDKFIKAIGKGTMAMFSNDGLITNEQLFWKIVNESFPTINDEMFIDFYKNEFKQTLITVGENQFAKQIVDFCKENFEFVVLSTNPLFPLTATKQRMEKVGLKEEDFDFVTAYENSSYCKPNPEYFISLLNKFGLKSDEVLVIGNNDYEDGECAFKAGIKCVLIGDNLIHDERCKMTFPHYKMEDVISFLKTII